MRSSTARGLIRGHEPVDDVFSGTEWEKTMDRSFGLETEPETSEGGVATFPQVRNRQDIAVQPASKPDVAIMSPKPKWGIPSLASLFMILCLLVGGGCLLPSLFSTGNEQIFQEEDVPRFITKNIEDVEEADYVLARDEFGSEIGLRRVIEVYRRTSDHLRILTFQANDGTQQTLETTNEHPFWVVGYETFTEAKNLKVGTKVTSPQGDLQTLVSTRYEPHLEGVAVFNFQVEGYHTYYVREHGTRGPPVLVHNADYPKIPTEVWEKQRIPKQVTPTGKPQIREVTKPSSRGAAPYRKVAEYDEYGRLRKITDYTDHAEPHIHPNPHHHLFGTDGAKIRNPDDGSFIFPGE